MNKATKVLGTLAMLAAMGLFAALPATAQQNAGQINPDQSGQAQSSPVSVTGCLQQSNGQFTITDATSGTTYNLMASDSSVDLNSHVNQKVRVTGTPSSESANAGSGASGQPAGEAGQTAPAQTLNVTHVHMVSKSCGQ